MKCPGISLFLVVIACIFMTGCTQPSGTPAPPAVETTVPTAVETDVPTAEATSTPQQVVTIIHQVSQVKDVKDSELLFSLQVPVEWNVSTRRLANPENFEGFMYQTDLVRNNTFYIHTFTNYRSRDQNYQNEFRQWSPAPNMTTVTINSITFDRFESTADGKTHVGYVARKGSMNEQGYLSVLLFTSNTSNQFEKEDYEKVVASFRYFRGSFASTMPGEEIFRIPPPKEEGGSAHSAVGDGSSRSSGGSSSGGSSPGGCSLR